jgi:hypothetical protein
MLTVLSAATDQEVAAFLTIAGMDRASVKSGGGVEHLLWQSSVGNIQVIEMTLDEEQDVQTLPRFLTNVFLMAAEVFEGSSEEVRIEYVFQTVRTLDRLILDEPLEAQPTLYGSLTEALLLVDEPLRSALPAAFAARAPEDASAKFLLHQFSLEGLGELIVRALRPGDVAGQVASLLGTLTLPPRTSAALISLLEERLRPPDAPPGWLQAGHNERSSNRSGPRPPPITNCEGAFGGSGIVGSVKL